MAMTKGHLTNKTDVYSFGIILLETHVLKSERKLMNLVDPMMDLEFNNEEMMATINVAIHYCNTTSKLRATMSAGYLTNKADVYNFGIILLEAHLLKSERKLMNLVDPRLGLEFNNEEMMATINVAIHYCNSTSKLRATMYVVVSMFEEKATV
ncbi:hypothetical protein DVH24_035802 [Malus domestica]|uniref:Serine-threonine/tyrosine-protein kinase catalytic domain-containing protein n=1 Tax=Malus domestica TaxID=3750 RepID=A0A498JTH7_MALDO|nr:hypothetical protein DVH24_035802 [Malus domestica]